MKNKLKKDLKFLRTWKGKLGLSQLFTWFTVWIAVRNFGLAGDDEGFPFLFAVSLASYVALYFFNAWIVGDEDEPESGNV